MKPLAPLLCLAACVSTPPPAECGAGTRPVANGCEAVCDVNEDCHGGHCDDGVCVADAEPPVIATVTGDDPGDATRVLHGLLVTGAGFDTADFELAGVSGALAILLEVTGSEAVTIFLPANMVSGTYLLTATNGAGSDDAEVTLNLPDLDGDDFIAAANQATALIDWQRLDLVPDAVIAAVNLGTTGIDSERLQLSGGRLISVVNTAAGSIDDARLPVTLGSLACADDQRPVRRGGAWSCEAAGPPRVSFVAKSSTSQTIGSTAAQVVTVIAALGQTGGGFLGNTFTAPVAGTYRFSGFVTSSFHGEIVTFTLTKNGATTATLVRSPPTVDGLRFVVVEELQVGDQIRLVSDSVADASYEACDGDGCMLAGELLVES